MIENLNNKKVKIKVIILRIYLFNQLFNYKKLSHIKFFIVIDIYIFKIVIFIFLHFLNKN